MKIFVRSPIAPDSRQRYEHLWSGFYESAVFEKVATQLDSPSPELRYAHRCRMFVIDLDEEWWSFVERVYLKSVQPVFYYPWRQDKSAALLPFHFIILYHAVHLGITDRESVIALLRDDLGIDEPADIIDALERHGFIRAAGRDRSIISLVTSIAAVAGVWRGSRIRVETEKDLPTLAGLGIHDAHATTICRLISESDSLTSEIANTCTSFDLTSALAFEHHFVTHIHELLNNYLYDEAHDLVDLYCQRLDPSSDESLGQNSALHDLEELTRNTYGAPLAELCGYGNSSIYAVALRQIPALLESGKLKRGTADGRYQLFGSFTRDTHR